MTKLKWKSAIPVVTVYFHSHWTVSLITAWEESTNNTILYQILSFIKYNW